MQINPLGRVSFISEDDDTSCRQQEQDIIQQLGNMLCRCLDYGLDVALIDSVNFEADMAELIAGMVLDQFDENDEGYEDEPAEGLNRKSCGSSSTRCFRSLEEIGRFCEARLLRKNIDTAGEHYRNVLTAMYVEGNELKTFLNHVTPSLQLASENKRCKLNPGAASTAQECVYEWARFWLQVMQELRRGVHLRKATQAKVSPLEYEFSPYEMAAERAEMTVSKPKRTSGLPENAGDIILDFILSRPAQRADIPREKDGSLDDSSDSELSTLPLKATEEETDHRKALRVHSPLWSKIDNWDWDASQDSLLSDDLVLNGYKNYWKEEDTAEPKQSLTYGHDLHPRKKSLENVAEISRKNSFDNSRNKTRRGSLETFEKEAREARKDGNLAADTSVKRKQIRRRRSAELFYDDAQVTTDRVSNNNLRAATDGYGKPGKTKKRLAVSMLCLTDIKLEDDPRVVGTSMFEISKIRQAITVAETESLDGKNRKNLSIKNGKTCFACQKTKFSLFHKSKDCEVCQKKFCSKCMVPNVEVPDHLVHLKTEHDDIEPSRGLGMTSGISKSLSNLTSDGYDTVTPFQCKRQSLLHVGPKKTFGGKLINVCKSCKCFMDAIIVETKNTRWHVGMAMDI